MGDILRNVGVSWLTSVSTIGALSGAGYLYAMSAVDQWKSILGGFLGDVYVRYMDGDIVSEEEMTDAAERAFDAVFDSADAIQRPVQSINRTYRSAKQISLGVSLVVGGISSLYVHGTKSKGKTVVAGAFYSMALYASIMASLFDPVGAGLQGFANMVDVEKFDRSSLKQALREAIKTMNIPSAANSNINRGL